MMETSFFIKDNQPFFSAVYCHVLLGTGSTSARFVYYITNIEFRKGIGAFYIKKQLEILGKRNWVIKGDMRSKSFRLRHY